jgi:hypothetical protein
MHIPPSFRARVSMRCRSWLPLLGLASALALRLPPAGAAEFIAARIALPPMANAPTINGVLDTNEWDGATRLIGFGTPLEPRTGATWVGYDAVNLYLAVRSEMPPDGKLLTNVLRHDENVCRDDSIEIWIDPNRIHRAAGAGDLRCYQIIVNRVGTLLDVAFDENAQANTGWDLKGHVVKTTVNTAFKTWDFEMAIPWASLGANYADLKEREVGLFLARNWKQPWNQATFLPIGGFAEFSKYPVFALRAEAPVIQEINLGPVFEAAVDYQLTVRNVTPAPVTYKARLEVTTSDMPPMNRAGDVAVGAHAVGRYDFASAAGALHKTATHVMSVSLGSADGKDVYFQRNLTLAPPREKTWQISGSAEESTAYFIAYYPAFNKLAVKVDLTDAEGAETITGAGIQLSDSVCKSLMTTNMAVATNRMGEILFDIPDLPDGTYKVSTTLKGDKAPARPFEKTFVREHFVWEDNILGLSDEVFPPFLPITIKGNRASVVLRELTMNRFGLWDSVKARDEELLDGPMTLEYSVDGRAGKWAHADGAFTQSKPSMAIYESTATSDRLQLKTRSTIDVDGCMKVEMKILPGAKPGTIDRLILNIPIRDDLAPLWHLCQSGSIRMNPTGAIPAGDGLIWDSTRTGNGAMLGTLLPYVWVGGPELGLAWFANNDKDWSIGDDQPALSLVRHKGRLLLQVQFIARPTALDKPRTIVFGLQASPTKPMPSNWRSEAAQDMPRHGGSGGYWGIIPHFAGKYPAGRDFTFADELLIARQTGRFNQAYMEKWVNEKIRANKDWSASFIDDRTRHVIGGMGCMPNAGKTPRLLYFEEHFQDQVTPEWVVFQDQWGKMPFTARNWDTSYARNDGHSAADINFGKSYQDFALWYAMQWYLRGMGLYCDNAYLHDCFNPLVSDAYVREDGQVQPSAMIWELREYHKRMWVLEKTCQKLTPHRLLINLHITNGHLLPVVTWGDVNLVNEWGYRNATEPWPPEIMQTEMTGLQTGNYTIPCLPIMGTQTAATPNLTPEQRDTLLKRAEWGTCRVHEIHHRVEPHQQKEFAAPAQLEKLIRDFGYGREDCDVIHYWDKPRRGPPVIAVANPQVKWIGFWKPATRELMLVLMNWTLTPQTTSIKAGRANVIDAETGAPWPAGDSTFPCWEVKVLKTGAQ